MDNFAHARFLVEDRSYLAVLKKEVHSLSVSAGFSPNKLHEIDIIVAEISSNLIKHANHGEILVRLTGTYQFDGIEIISIDNGPGIADPDSMLKDGSSTTNTLGNGLGAIKRLSDHLAIYSMPGWGTILLCRVYKNSQMQDAREDQHIASVIVPMKGELFCGDGYFKKQDTNLLQVFVGDGLGHGAEAHYSISLAIDSFKKNKSTDPVELIRTMHDNIKKSRGIVGTIVIYDTKTKILKMAGVGNISSRFCGIINKSCLAYNGIIGSNIPNTMNEQVIQVEPPQLLIMYSDGIKSGWDYLKYPRILKHDLTVLAAAIYKDNTRNKDDASVVVIRLK